MRVGVAAGMLALGAATALGGCGSDETAAIRAKVNQFAAAAAKRDYATICDQVLAPSLVQRLSSADVSCVQAMQIALGGVQDPTLSIGKISVSGDHASAITLTAARNQVASLDSIDLVRTSRGWRISALASPLTSTTTVK